MNKIKNTVISLLLAGAVLSGCSLEGPQGPKGDQGEPGLNGQPGTNGVDGQDGKDGVDGQDGKDGTNGKDGVDGKDGTDGTDGISIVSITKIDSGGIVDTYKILFSDDTFETFKVTNGKDGASAYELYCQEHKDYEGSLQDWLDLFYKKDETDYTKYDDFLFTEVTYGGVVGYAANYIGEEEIVKFPKAFKNQPVLLATIEESAFSPKRGGADVLPTLEEIHFPSSVKYVSIPESVSERYDVSNVITTSKVILINLKRVMCFITYILKVQPMKNIGQQICVNFSHSQTCILKMAMVISKQLMAKKKPVISSINITTLKMEFTTKSKK